MKNKKHIFYLTNMLIFLLIFVTNKIDLSTW